MKTSRVQTNRFVLILPQVADAVAKLISSHPTITGLHLMSAWGVQLDSGGRPGEACRDFADAASKPQEVRRFWTST